MLYYRRYWYSYCTSLPHKLILDLTEEVEGLLISKEYLMPVLVLILLNKIQPALLHSLSEQWLIRSLVRLEPKFVSRSMHRRSTDVDVVTFSQQSSHSSDRSVLLPLYTEPLSNVQFCTNYHQDSLTFIRPLILRVTAGVTFLGRPVRGRSSA
jgi:hypothetical protein